MTHSSQLIVLSAGGDDTELAKDGLGMEHINELMVRLSRKLLQDGHRLAYGGTLGVAGDELTEFLIDAALGWLKETFAKDTDLAKPSTWPLINYGSWPYYTLIKAEHKAELVGVCDFINVKPLREYEIEVDETELAELLADWKTNLSARRHTANALSRMRLISTQETDLRVVWGGKIAGAAGWMAGIAEEVLCSLEANKPTIILGGFGGCARVLADFLKHPSAPWPQELTLEQACQDPKYRKLITNHTERRHLANRYQALKDNLTDWRTTLGQKKGRWGIDTDTFQGLFETTSPRHAIQLVQKGIHSLSSAA